jgi:hypothetical protein
MQVRNAIPGIRADGYAQMERRGNPPASGNEHGARSWLCARGQGV